MDFSLVCDYYSYCVGGRFKVWFSCTAQKPELISRFAEMNKEEDTTPLWQRRALLALSRGDCRLSWRGSGRIVFEGHEFSSTVKSPEEIEIRVSEDCAFILHESDINLYVA